MPYKWFSPKKQYTFHDYFTLNPPIEELVAHFGYAHEMVERYDFSATPFDESFFDSLKSELLTNIKHANLTSETARRETLIGPILLKVAAYLDIKVQFEYPLRVSPQLGGQVDYLLQHQGQLLVVEAKQADLQRGFIQLAAELMAFDQWTDSDTPTLYGCVSVGDVWRFAVLERTKKRIVEELYSYSVPVNTPELVHFLVNVLR